MLSTVPGVTVTTYPRVDLSTWRQRKRILIRCQDWDEHKGCHEKLDSMDVHEIVQFEDFDDIMAYRFKHAPEEYNKMITAISEAGIKLNYNYYESTEED